MAFDKIKDKFFKGGSSEFDANTFVRITEQGAGALEQDRITSLKEYDILSTLHEHSPQTLSKVASNSQINVSETRDHISRLKKQGFVQIVED